MSSRDPFLRLDDRFTHLIRVDQAVLLVGDDRGLLLESGLTAQVVEQVDGTRSAVAIAQALEGEHPPELVHFVLLNLEREGLVRAVDPAQCTIAESRSPGGRTSPEAALAARLKESWEKRGSRDVVPVELDEGPAAGRILLLTDDYLRSDLNQVRQAAAPGTEGCLLARVGARNVWLGPWILPGRTPCIVCLQERLRLNLLARALLHVAPGQGNVSSFSIQRMIQDVEPEAFVPLARALLDERVAPEAPGRLRVLPVEEGPAEEHAVIRLPHCPECGDPTRGPKGEDFALRPVPWSVRSGGGYRSVPPQVTLQRLAPLVSPLTGAIRYVRKVPVEGAAHVHVYTASHAHSYGPSSLRTLRSDRRDHSGGKGMTDLDARVSALCESVERFSGVYRGNERLRVARRSELGPGALHPNHLLLFSETQLRDRLEWNAGEGAGFQWVPEPYLDELVEWSRARSIVSGETFWVPSAAVYLGFRGEGRRFYRGDSNGLASGNCLEEAILQGFLELAERDSVALWWYNRARRPGVDLDSFRDPRIRDAATVYSRLRRSLWALDLTSDLAIPTFAALSARTGGGAVDIIFGFGAHLDPEIALLRSLAELNQMLPTVQRTPEERRRQLLPDFVEAIRWWETATLEEYPHLLPDPQLPPRIQKGIPSHSCTDLLDGIQRCVDRAQEAGCDVLVHDLTRPDVGFPVARVMVPGLRHFWRRLGPGRLYQVPLELGWVDSVRAEEEMNPVSLFV
jgi:oxazoline/thiazoline synthase